MTDRELGKLRRRELLELLFAMRRELDKTKKENAALSDKLETQQNKLDELLELARLTADKLGVELEDNLHDSREQPDSNDSDIDCKKEPLSETEQ